MRSWHREENVYKAFGLEMLTEFFSTGFCVVPDSKFPLHSREGLLAENLPFTHSPDSV